MICHIYNFDMELRSLLFDMTCKIEVALRARFCEALLQKNDALIYMDSSIFKEKEIFWKNASSISLEIAQSTDVFIAHNYKNHDGQIPLWAAVEVMSFGTLSKCIKNLKTGNDSVYPNLAQFYKYTSEKGNLVTPSIDMLSSWIHAVVVLRNICAHNSRIYNRSLSTKPKLLNCDQQNPSPRYYGLYHIILAMKYLRPSDSEWLAFINSFIALLNKYQNEIDLNRLHFPTNWKDHIQNL